MRLLTFLCLALLCTGCARDPDAKTYGIPIATAEDIKAVVCPNPRLQPATAVACPESAN